MSAASIKAQIDALDASILAERAVLLALENQRPPLVSAYAIAMQQETAPPGNATSPANPQIR
jgi:hypothetical protein